MPCTGMSWGWGSNGVPVLTPAPGSCACACAPRSKKRLLVNTVYWPMTHVEERRWHHVGAHRDLELVHAVEEVVKVSEAEHVLVVRRGHDGVQWLAGVEE